MPKIKLMRPHVSRVRHHVRRRSFNEFDYDLVNFLDGVKRIGTENSIGLLRDMADNEEFWELIGLAGRLQDERNEVLKQIDKLRTKLAVPYVKKLKAKRNSNQS